MNTQIILASLRARPVRTAVSVLAVALEVTLILLLVGLTAGIVDETGKRPAGVGAEIVFMAPDASYIMALNTSAMPVEIGEKIKEVEGVKAVAPILTFTNPGGGYNIVYGIEPESFNAASGGFDWLDGQMFSGPEEVIIDDWYASDEGLNLGNEIMLKNRKFKVSGIVKAGKGARIFIPLLTAQTMGGREGYASMFYVKIHDKDQVKEVVARMGKGTDFEGYKVTDVREFASLMASATGPLLDAFFKVVVAVAVSIGVLVIFLSMYTTITERTREIGILRSLGASKGFIITLILQESILLCIGGIALGTGVSYVLRDVIQTMFPTLVILITPAWLVRAALFAVLSAIIGCLYPSIKAANKDPVEALAYE